MTEIIKLPIEEFTEATLDGNGVFDVLMQANKAHLLEEYSRNRIKGPEYASVYLGSLERTMAISLEFFIQARKSKLEESLLEKQIELADSEIKIAAKKLEMMDCEKALCQANISKVNAETAMVTAQMDKIPHEIEMAQAQAELSREQVLIAKEEVLIAKENLKKIPIEIDQLEVQTLQIEEQTRLLGQQIVLAVLEETTVAKQHCKLDAEFDAIMASIGKTNTEGELLVQKTVTERAQTSSAAVDPDSVIGKQKLLYAAQTKGFELDAYAVMAKELLSTWNVRVTTDSDGNGANAQNKLDDINIGKVVQAWGQKHGVVL